MKTLLRRYYDFLRVNESIQGEFDPGHKEYIGAQVRMLHATLPEQEGRSKEEDQCRGTLLSLYFLTGQFRDAMAMWKCFPEDDKYSAAVVSVVIDGCGIERRLGVAEQVWEELRARQQPDANTWDAWLECLAKHSRESFRRARDIMVYEMGPNGDASGVPAADVGSARMLLSFSDRHGELEETTKIIQTHLPSTWSKIWQTKQPLVQIHRWDLKGALLRATTMDKSAAAQRFFKYLETHGHRDSVLMVEEPLKHSLQIRGSVDQRVAPWLARGGGVKLDAKLEASVLNDRPTRRSRT